MNPEKLQFLNLRRIPARLFIPEVTYLSNFTDYDLRVLAETNILVPLNDYGVGTVKVYFGEDVLDFAADRKRVARATRVIYEYWRDKNKQRGKGNNPPPFQG